MLKIKSDDEVIILAGKDKGKRGKVRKVLDNDKVCLLYTSDAADDTSEV